MKKLDRKLAYMLGLILSIGVYSHNLVAQQHCSLQAKTTLSEITQPNGEYLSIQVIGNRFLFYVETEDNYSLVKDQSDGYYKYARLDTKGSLVSDGVIAHNLGKRSASEKLYLSSKAKRLRYTGKTLKRKLKAQDNFVDEYISVEKNTGSANGSVPSTGTIKHILLLIDYPDQPFAYNNSAFDNLMNQIGYNVNNQKGSFKEFYLDNSYNQLTVETDVLGWYTAKFNKAYYAANFPTKARELVREAVDAAEGAGVDFSLYDNNLDGNCDVITVAHSGRGQEETGDPDDIWSHKTGLGSLSVTYDGTRISSYTINPERLGRNNIISHVGVYVHEFGHALGLPDLYDTNGSTDGRSPGAGRWCSMANSWGGGGASPCHFGPWCKEALGWITPTVLSGTGRIANMDNVHNGPNYYRINTPDPEEYYLICNNQGNKWNDSHPGEGLMIWHIDLEDCTNGGRLNDNTSLLGFIPEQADGRNDMEKDNNGGDSGDPFPGSSNNTEFNGTSSPNSFSNNGVASEISISGITENSGLISFNYSTTVRFPVELISFDVQVIEDGSVQIHWETASEINNDYFTIERSTDSRVWEPQSRVEGAGNSLTQLSYSVNDPYPYDGVSYYRLKQSDFDNRVDYSEVKSIMLDINDLVNKVELYPNPVSDLLTLEGRISELSEIHVYNVLGQDVSHLTKVDKRTASQADIDFSSLSPGLYYIKTSTQVQKVYRE